MSKLVVNIKGVKPFKELMELLVKHENDLPEEVKIKISELIKEVE